MKDIAASIRTNWSNALKNALPNRSRSVMAKAATTPALKKKNANNSTGRELMSQNGSRIR